jgi:hypothetical protein
MARLALRASLESWRARIAIGVVVVLGSLSLLATIDAAAMTEPRLVLGEGVVGAPLLATPAQVREVFGRPTQSAAGGSHPDHQVDWYYFKNNDVNAGHLLIDASFINGRLGSITIYSRALKTADGLGAGVTQARLLRVPGMKCTTGKFGGCTVVSHFRGRVTETFFSFVNRAPRAVSVEFNASST